MTPTAGWYPVEISAPGSGQPVLHWQDLTTADFTSPFFEDTQRRARHQQQSKFRHTTLEDFPALPAALPPAAFIFHTSRSGSTLLCQLLSCLAGTLALSEPPILDQVFQLPQNPSEKAALVRRTISALGQRRLPTDRFVFFKNDSWHLPWLPLIRQIYPATPCLFVHRHPVEILWSHHRQRGSQMVPELLDSSLFGIAPGSYDPGNLDAYAARVLEFIFARALQHVEGGDLIPLVHHRLLAHFHTEVLTPLGIHPSPSELAAIHQRSHFHSKHASQPYSLDSEPRIPSRIRQQLESLAAPALMPLYEKLDAAASCISSSAPPGAAPCHCGDDPAPHSHPSSQRSL